MSISIPDQGLCATCEETVRLRRDGRAYVHPNPYDPDGPIVGTITDAGTVWHNDCFGSGELPAVRLEMTFARWLHAHVARRDARDNPVTYLAQRTFHGCTRAPVKAVTAVDWTTVEELHQQLHREPGRAGDCDWVCRYAEQAAVRFAEYRAAQAS